MGGGERVECEGEDCDVACPHWEAHSDPTNAGDNSTIGVYPLYNWLDAHIHSAGEIESVP